MATAASSMLPSIKISRTSPGGESAPITPISDGSHSPDVERPTTADRNSTTPRPSNTLGRGWSPSQSNGDAEGGGGARRGSSAVDPLTMQILRRSGTENTIPKKLRQDGDEEGGKVADGTAASDRGSPDPAVTKEKKKGVSFLSRIIGNNKKKAGLDGEEEDAEAAEGDRRTEGMDAQIFSQPIGYIPQHPAPPKYIRVRSHHKPQRDFNQTFLAQELFRSPGPDGPENGNRSSVSVNVLPQHKTGAIWAMKFSKDGRYLAAAGQEKVVRVWQVIASEDERAAHEKEEDAAWTETGLYSGGQRLNAPVFRSEPVQEYHGHTGDVLDLSWSKNNFLLSSSMDKTVRLWHVTRKECLCCFQHSDFVTAICFHPRDDRFFLAGSLDSKLRLWSIPDKSVAFWNELPDLITAVSFTPDGRMAIAGCLSGLCLFYETEGLRYHTQVHVKSSHGRNAKGSKITGIETTTFPPDDPNGEVKILITSNDSRVRIYNARDKSLEVKFKGYENTCSQIHATFSDDAKYIISGSEDRKVYIWNIAPGDTDKKNKRPVEFFEAHPAIVTVAVMAPTKTKQLLGNSGDPLYDLCNPPAVTLVSRSESIASSRRDNDSLASPPPSSHATPRSVPTSPESRRPGSNARASETPAHAARSSHPGGNIIVTADYTGRIKVFRQDCAFKRRRHDGWETASILSKKRASGSSRRRESTSQRSNTITSSPEHISNWRNSVASSADSITGGSLRAGRASILDAESLRNRSVSPRKSFSAMSISSNGMGKLGSLKRRSRGHSLGANTGDSPRNSRLSITSRPASMKDQPSAAGPDAATAADPMMIQETGQSLTYYNSSSFPTSAAGHNHHHHRGSSEDSADDDVFSSDGEDSDGEAVRCKKCSSTSFKARQSRKGDHKLVCMKCNTVL